MMQTVNIRRKIGTPYINDTKEGLIIPLPSNYNIIHYSSNIWVGGSTDGQHYLHIEKYRSESGDIPNILADGDLDMVMLSRGKEDSWQHDIKGVTVRGTLGPDDMQGYLMQWNMSDGQRYIILLASQPDQYSIEMAHNCFQIIQSIKSQMESRLAA